MLGKLLSKAGQALWLVLSCIAMLWIGYEGMIRHQGPLGWLEANGYLNPLTALFVFRGVHGRAMAVGLILRLNDSPRHVR